jgi:hypothetical protein
MLGISAKRNWGRRRTQGVAVLATVLTGVMISAAESAPARLQSAAHAARSLNSTATAHLHLVMAEGSQLTEEGPATGALSGWVQAQLNTGAVFTGSFTIHTHGGTIKGRGRAIPNGSGRYESFGGSFTVTSGSGRYRHIKGHAGLYGVFDRRTDSAVIQTTGKLTY